MIWTLTYIVLNVKSIENLIFKNPSPGEFPFLRFLHVEKRIWAQHEYN